MKEKAGQLVQGVKDQRVVPENYGDAKRAHGQGVVHLEPEQLVRVKQGLHHARQVDHVAEVQHEIVVLGRFVHEVAGNEQKEHKVAVEWREPIRMSERRKI